MFRGGGETLSPHHGRKQGRGTSLCELVKALLESGLLEEHT